MWSVPTVINIQFNYCVFSIKICYTECQRINILFFTLFPMSQINHTEKLHCKCPILGIGLGDVFCLNAINQDELSHELWINANENQPKTQDYHLFALYSRNFQSIECCFITVQNAFHIIINLSLQIKRKQFEQNHMQSIFRTKICLINLRRQCFDYFRCLVLFTVFLLFDSWNKCVRKCVPNLRL